MGILEWLFLRLAGKAFDGVLKEAGKHVRTHMPGSFLARTIARFEQFVNIRLLSPGSVLAPIGRAPVWVEGRAPVWVEGGEQANVFGDDEQAQLDQWTERICTGKCRFLLLWGIAGAGKSTLAEALRRRAMGLRGMHRFEVIARIGLDGQGGGLQVNHVLGLLGSCLCCANTCPHWR